MTDQQIEIAVFRKANGGLLSKRIFLEDGEVVADGSECRMARGTAWRVKLNGVASLAELINTMRSDEALTLGRLRAGLPDQCRVIVKDKLNGALPPDVIARTTDFLQFADRQPAYMLIDHDTKHMRTPSMPASRRCRYSTATAIPCSTTRKSPYASRPASGSTRIGRSSR
jgi:hypothetical protein